MIKNRYRHNLNAFKLIEMIQNKRLGPDELTARQRRLVVKYYMEEVSETSNRAIALLIGVSDLHVSRLKRDLLKKASWEVEHIDVKIMATAFKKKKEELQRRAMEGQDYSLAWKIECDYIAKMQDLGFIYKEPEKHLVGSIELDMERGLMEYFEENGVPSVSQFIERMSQIGDGNGNGSKPGENTKLLAKSVN